MARHSFVVFSDPMPGRETEYNDWYDTQHMPDVLKVPGFIAAQRFRLQGDGPGGCRYMAIYEIESDDIAAAMQELTSRAGTAAMPTSDALDVSRIQTFLAEASGSRLVAEPSAI